MLPKEELNALRRTLEDAIQEAVPDSMASDAGTDCVAFQTMKNGSPETFCLLVAWEDRLEVCFPDCPDGADSGGAFEMTGDGRACRVVIRTRADIPGEALSAACKAAAKSV